MSRYRSHLGASSLLPLATALALCLAAPAYAQSKDPIKIGVIAEVQSIAGADTGHGAQIAADEINAKGGILGRKIEIVTYDNKSSSADSVRAFQRAVSEDKVSAAAKPSASGTEPPHDAMECFDIMLFSLSVFVLLAVLCAAAVSDGRDRASLDLLLLPVKLPRSQNHEL